MVYDFNNFPQGAIYKKPLKCRIFGHKWYYGYDYSNLTLTEAISVERIWLHTMVRYCSKCNLVEYIEKEVR